MGGRDSVSSSLSLSVFSVIILKMAVHLLVILSKIINQNATQNENLHTTQLTFSTHTMRPEALS